LGTADNCPISSTALSIEGDVIAAEIAKRGKRKDKSYTCKSRGGIIQEFELTLEYLMCFLAKS